jgi:hypothetical protein
MEWQRPEATDQIKGERRNDKRYAISLDVRWRLLRRKKLWIPGRATQSIFRPAASSSIPAVHYPLD